MFWLVLVDIDVPNVVSVNGSLLTLDLDQTRLKLIESAIIWLLFHLIILVNLICIIVYYVYISQIQVLINFHLLD